MLFNNKSAAITNSVKCLYLCGWRFIAKINPKYSDVSQSIASCLIGGGLDKNWDTSDAQWLGHLHRSSDSDGKRETTYRGNTYFVYAVYISSLDRFASFILFRVIYNFWYGNLFFLSSLECTIFYCHWILPL